MFTTAGNTCFTSGAKLFVGTNAAAAGEADAAWLAAGGFSGHTMGDRASVAPRPKPSAAARVFLNQGWREEPAGSPVINDSPVGSDDRWNMPWQGDRPLSGGLIRR